jgi:hypothetical protein
MEFGQQFGNGRFLDDAGRGLLKRAERLSASSASPKEWELFHGEAARVIKSLPDVEASFLARTLYRYLKNHGPSKIFTEPIKAPKVQ